MTKLNLMQEIMVAVSKAGARVFRNNTGLGWIGEATHHGTTVVIKNARPLHAGLCVGSADLIGWSPRVITQEMVGTTVAVFTAIEVKEGSGRLTKEQTAFLEAVAKDGGLAIEGRDVAGPIYTIIAR